MNIEIKDRVAVGDNKYTMKTLSDGRVELTPSPDSVQEVGTPLNKELLQPIVDAVPIVYTLLWTFNWQGTSDEVNKLEFFHSDQTLKGLVAALNENERVEIQIIRLGTARVYEAEIAKTPVGVHFIQFFDRDGSTGLLLHRWTVTTNGFTYIPYEISKRIEANSSAIEVLTPIVYYFTWHPEERDELRFENPSQTINSLLADLEANKNIKIKIKQANQSHYYDAEIISKYTDELDFPYVIHINDLAVNYDLGSMIINHFWKITSTSLQHSKIDISDDLQILLPYVFSLEERIKNLESKIS